MEDDFIAPRLIIMQVFEIIIIINSALTKCDSSVPSFELMIFEVKLNN